jgi:pimeloyl-ACP methyl ester carboxylesterase
MLSQLMTWNSASGQQMRTSFCDSGGLNEDEIPLVLVHGVGMNKMFWKPQIDHFAASRRVIAYDMIGHGQSSTSSADADADLALFSEQLSALMDHLGIDMATVVGHSMGALVGLEFALANPKRVRRLAALNAVYCRPPSQRQAVESRAEALLGGRDARVGIYQTLDRWFGHDVEGDARAIANWVRDNLLAADPLGYAQAYTIFATSDERHRGRLERLHMPALFMTGEFDANSSPDMSRAMALEAPQGTCVVIAGQRHMMSLVAPGAVNAALDRFLEGDATSRAASAVGEESTAPSGK